MRTTRNLSEATKKKISDSIKKKHSQRGIDQKRKIAEKQSKSMQNYWKSIPRIKK